MDAMTVNAACEVLLVVIGLIGLLLMVGKERRTAEFEKKNPVSL